MLSVCELRLLVFIVLFLQLRERADDLDLEVRKLKSEKRMLMSQYNDVKTSHEAALSQVSLCCSV